MVSRAICWRLAMVCGILTAAAMLTLGLLLMQDVSVRFAASSGIDPADYLHSDRGLFGNPYRFIAIGAVAAGALVGGAVLLVARAAEDPLRQLTDMARRMAEGDLDRRAHLSASKEVQELAQAFSQTAYRLRGMVSTLSGERNTMEAMLESLDDGIIITDRTGKVMLVNPSAERMLHISKDRAVGRSFMGVVLDHELQGILNRCLQTREQQSAQIELGSSRRILQVLARPVPVEPGPVGLVVLKDLTEIRRADLIRREFISNVSHELRTPLASLKLLVETLQEGAIDDKSAAQSFLHRMNVEVDGLTQLVRELLELSRIESGRAPLNLEPISLDTVIRQTVERLRPQAERAGLVIDVSLPEGLPLAMADQDRVGQVLMNLIFNAIKFTPSGGSILVGAESRGAELAVTVADTGVGIPPEDLQRIFERFYKADKARSSGGTGLGLAIAKHLVHSHGGVIRAENRPGKGAIFTFTLPVAGSSIADQPKPVEDLGKAAS